jgi:hypothetical protein
MDVPTKCSYTNTHTAVALTVTYLDIIIKIETCNSEVTSNSEHLSGGVGSLVSTEQNSKVNITVILRIDVL